MEEAGGVEVPQPSPMRDPPTQLVVAHVELPILQRHLLYLRRDVPIDLIVGYVQQRHVPGVPGLGQVEREGVMGYVELHRRLRRVEQRQRVAGEPVAA